MRCLILQLLSIGNRLINLFLTNKGDTKGVKMRNPFYYICKMAKHSPRTYKTLIMDLCKGCDSHSLYALNNSYALDI